MNSRPARVFVVAFPALLTLLLIRSGELFTRVIYEEGDFAANSIITYHAKHFDQLVGNYSRVGFNHPGPGYFYVQALGEWLLYDVFHLVPAPWNGQAVAIIALNAVLVALALSVLARWLPWPPVVAASGVVLLFLATHELLLSSTWMPFVYFAPFLLLLISASSVAAGRLEDLWMVALAGSLLIHGHAEFLFFVPLLVLASLWPHRRDLDRRALLIAAGVVAVFAVPIVLNLVLHWPGEFARYLGYGRKGVHWPWEAARYQVQFWPGGLVVMAVLFAAAWFLGRGQPLLRAGVRIIGLAALLFYAYALYGIDHLDEGYVGYFSRAMPLALMLLGAAGVVARWPARPVGMARWPARVVAIGVLAVGLVAASLSSNLVNRRGEVPGVPAALDAMARLAGDRPAVVDVAPDTAWAEAVPLVIAGHRRGMRVCLRDERWRLIVTDEFICTAAEVATGERFLVNRGGVAPDGAFVVADVSPSVVTVPWVRVARTG